MDPQRVVCPSFSSVMVPLEIYQMLSWCRAKMTMDDWPNQHWEKSNFTIPTLGKFFHLRYMIEVDLETFKNVNFFI